MDGWMDEWMDGTAEGMYEYCIIEVFGVSVKLYHRKLLPTCLVSPSILRSRPSRLSIYLSIYFGSWF